MTDSIDAARIREWIDDDLVAEVDRMPDEAAEFNLLVDVSNIQIHVIRRDPDGPLLIGQQLEYDEEIRRRIQSLSSGSRNELVARIRETLTTAPIIYGFHDMHGNNVRFAETHRVFVEHRIYPGAIDQQALMDGLLEVWRVMRYLDDVVTLIESVEQ